MSNDDQRLAQAIARIDQANAEDPNQVSINGKNYPAELIYSERMIAWLERIEPDASDALRLAVRCQHLRRWIIPRSQYPMTRPGYFQWRSQARVIPCRYRCRDFAGRGI